MADEKKESASAFLEQALAWFRTHGVTAQRVMTDNGSAYRSRLFATAIAAHGLRHKRTKPYRPGPTARPSASSRPASANGPTPRPTHHQRSAPRPCTPGCTTTTPPGPTPLSAGSLPSAASLGTTYLAMTHPLHEDVVPPGAAAIHADRNRPLLQHPRERRAGELAALVGIEDLRLAMPGQRRGHGIAAELGLQRDRQGHPHRRVRARGVRACPSGPSLIRRSPVTLERHRRRWNHRRSGSSDNTTGWSKHPAPPSLAFRSSSSSNGARTPMLPSTARSRSARRKRPVADREERLPQPARRSRRIMQPRAQEAGCGADGSMLPRPSLSAYAALRQGQIFRAEQGPSLSWTVDPRSRTSQEGEPAVVPVGPNVGVAPAVTETAHVPQDGSFA